MTIKDDIQAAATKLDPRDDSHWTPEGKPALTAIRTLADDPRVKQYELDDALGKMTRPAVEPAPPAASTETIAPAAQAAPGEGTGIAPPLQHPAANAADDAREDGTGDGKQAPDAPADPVATHEAQMKATVEAIAALDPQIAELEQIKREADGQIKALVSERDKHAVRRDELADQTSHAEMVKRIQKQTQDNLMRQRVVMGEVANVLKSHGVATHASRLDQAHAMRKRTTEQATNAAKFYHNHNAARLAERMGTV